MRTLRSTLPFCSAAGLAGLLGTTMLAVFLYAPREATMGDVQRIVYLHVAVAWCGLAGCVAMGAAGVTYLLGRDHRWDCWSQAAGEVGWLCATLTLITGSMWAHEAWNTWWTWEPRLTATLVLWTVYAGCFLVRSSVEDPVRRARISAVLATVAMADVPLVIMATRWFRGIHPVAPAMDPRMRLVLWVSVVSFTALMAALILLRRRQLEQVAQIEALEQALAGA